MKLLNKTHYGTEISILKLRKYLLKSNLKKISRTSNVMNKLAKLYKTGKIRFLTRLKVKLFNDFISLI